MKSDDLSIQGCYDVVVHLIGEAEPVTHCEASQKPYMQSGCLVVRIEREGRNWYEWRYPTERVKSWMYTNTRLIGPTP